MKLCPPCPDIEMMLIDRAFDLLAPHHLQRMLHQEERRPHVDREHGVEERRARYPRSSPVGDACRVDEHVDAAEGAVGLGHDALGCGRIGEVGGHEFRPHALGRERLAHALAAFRTAPGDDQPGRAAVGEEMRDRLPEPLRGAGDDGDLAGKRQVFRAMLCPWCTS